MLLILDAETTGLNRPDLPPDDPSQPHICELGVGLWDGAWNKRASFDMLIAPNGWEIESGATAVHGITNDDCTRFGVPLTYALGLLQALAEKALFIAGFNVNFDRTMVASELSRMGASGIWWAKRGRSFRCAMEAATPILKIPSNSGYSSFKYPTLEEAHALLCPEVEFVQSHRAGPDIEATARIYRALEERGSWK